MNVYDSNRMANMLEEMGLVKAGSQKDADVVVFNTCHIREKAAEKVFSDLGREYQIKLERAEEGKDTIIGVTGCVVQAEDKEILKRAPYEYEKYISVCLYRHWQKSRVISQNLFDMAKLNQRGNLGNLSAWLKVLAHIWLFKKVVIISVLIAWYRIHVG